MKERSIIFKSEMVVAILEGRKTQTRRPIKFPPDVTTVRSISKMDEFFKLENHGIFGHVTSPYGKVGDRLWVKETFRCGSKGIYDTCKKLKCHMPYVEFKAGGGQYHMGGKEKPQLSNQSIKWTPSIHMPRWASRILLEITDVRVERLQDISEEDSLREGIEICNSGTPFACYWDYLEQTSRSPVLFNASDSFYTLWQSNYYETYFDWYSNPWVWVYDFKFLEVKK